MNLGIYPLAASMVNQFNRIDVISNNLANSNTTAFKEKGVSETSFNEYLDKAKDKSQENINPISSILNIIPKIDMEYTNSNIGTFINTGNELNFAIKEKDMFFKVKNSNNGEINYSRDGTFYNVEDKLVTKNGFEVLDNMNQPIMIDNDLKSNISLVKLDFKELNNVGNNNYTLKVDKEIKNVDESDFYLLDGYLESSNINSVTSMVSLIEANRDLERAQKAMTSIDELNGKVIEKIGDGRI